MSSEAWEEVQRYRRSRLAADRNVRAPMLCPKLAVRYLRAESKRGQIDMHSMSLGNRFWILTSAALLVLCFGLAASLDVWFQSWQGNRMKAANVLSTMLGDGRKMFARRFFVKADAYFHSGYYPTVFDNRESFKTPHMAEDTGAVGGQNTGDENSFLGKPRDWIDAFGRRFYPSVHT